MSLENLELNRFFRVFLLTILNVLVWVFPGGPFNGAEIIINISVYCSGFYAFEKFYVGQQIIGIHLAQFYKTALVGNFVCNRNL